MPVASCMCTSGSFVYDGNHKRVRQTINGETIYSVYNLAGQLVHRLNVTNISGKDYMRLGAMPIGWREGGTGTVRYTHKDHLGSPQVATDFWGNVVYQESSLLTRNSHAN